MACFVVRVDSNMSLFEPSVKSELNSPSSSSTTMRFAPPPRFDGEADANPDANARAMVSWIDLMSDHIRRLALTVQPWSEEIALEVAISFLDKEPRKAAKRLQKELDAKATWTAIAEELLLQFAPKASPYDILNALSTVVQGSLSLQSYIGLFTNRLEDAVDVGFSDAVSAAQMFLKGLHPDMRVAMVDALSLKVDDPWKSWVTMKPMKVIRELSQLAVRRADFVMLKREREVEVVKQARVAMVDVSAVARSGAPGSTNGTRGDDEVRKLRREAFIKSSSAQFGLPAALVRERIQQHVCIRCGKYDHHVRACAAPAPVGSLAPAVEQPKAAAR